MIQTGFENKIKIQELVQNQVPEFILDENPKFVEFLKQYYISQEYQSSSVNILDNIDEYLKLDNLTPDIIDGKTILSENITSNSTTIKVESTKGFPNSYGLIEIGDEIITYKEKTSNSFIDCIRGFSGIKQYAQELIFDSSLASSHLTGSSVKNLSVLFLQEFYSKIKYTLLPELSKISLDADLNVNNFLKNSKSLYQTKGTKESFRILFNALYGIKPSIIDLETFLIKPSDGEHIRRKELLLENLSVDKDPSLLLGNQIYKSNDPLTFGSISDIEIFTRNNKIYYKFLIFIGYDESNSESSGEFIPTSSSKIVHSILSSDNANTITLDSTINFPKSGSVYYNNNEIFYTEKSVNQLFGCYTENKTYIDLDIPKKSIIVSNDTYYGYQGGIQTEDNKLIFRLINVISGVSLQTDQKNNYPFDEGESIYVKNLGTFIENPENNKSNKEILSNSLIYNTSCRYKLYQFDRNSNTATTLSKIEPSSLKVGDYVEFLERTTTGVVSDIKVESLSNVRIESIDVNIGRIQFNKNLLDLNSLKQYDIRRKIVFASSSLIPLKYKDITSDVTNLYSEDDDNLYVASNSLPSYEIDANIFEYFPKSLVDFSDTEKKYSSLEFDTELSIITGDRVYYNYENNPIEGLEKGYYYVKVSSDYKKIKLYISKSSIDLDKFVYIGSQSYTSIVQSEHSFTLISQQVDDKKIYPQKIFKKFELNKNQQKEIGTDIGTETIGILANGVEILSYKSKDKIYYGPLESVQIINSGENYDVINPPRFVFSSGSAKIQPVLEGSIQEILIDPQEFDIKKPINIVVTGGNGKNLVTEPVIRKRSREVFFDARILEEGGGLSIDSETVTFLTDHNFTDGQKVIYDINNINNEKIGIGPYQGSNLSTGNLLGNNTPFYVKVINSKTVRLYPTLSDFRSGINTVGFTTIGNFGIHKFKTEPKTVLDSVKVLNGGEGFTNRKLIVKQSGISTYSNTISFPNHGFSTGEVVTYEYETSPITGLSTSVQYQVLRVNNDSFRLCNIGVGGTNNTNYLRKKYEKLKSTGSGYQYFSYPKITAAVKYLQDGQELKEITATPIVRGKISDIYLYEKGSNYGSTTVNLESKPDIKILDGQNGEVTPVISGGKITSVIISYAGVNYNSVPELKIDTKSGVGARLRCEIKNGKISKVIILSSGYNYKSEDTFIRVVNTGKNVTLNPKIRSLTLNNSYKYGSQKSNYRDPSSDLLYKTKQNNLQYTVIGYFDKLKTIFGEDSAKHSKIIGWSYDGNPIYGPYGYSDPTNSSSPVKLLTSGYSSTNVENRPSTNLFPLGYFIDDYIYSNNGDLDQYNGRFCKTPDFPDGVYAYFATSILNSNTNYIGVFPYFIGLKYRSSVISENISQQFNQNYNFRNSKLLRNTLPYKSSDLYANYEFFDQSLQQICEVDSKLTGNIDSIKIVNKGEKYKVGDLLYFEGQDNSENGYGLSAYVSEIEGKKIESIQSKVKIFENAKFYSNGNDQFYVKYLPNFDIPNNPKIKISGLSTEYSSINKTHNIIFENFTTTLTQNNQYTNVGVVTDIIVRSIPSRVSIGSSIKIIGQSYNVYYTVLNCFNDLNTLRVKNTSAGLSTQGSLVTFLSDVIIGQESISKLTEPENYPRYFNPRISLGIGTYSGVITSKSFYIGTIPQNISIPTQSIYIPNHGFKTNQKVILKRPVTGAAAIQVQLNPDSSPFNLLGAGQSEETVYIISKSKDLIGIVTNPARISDTNGLYFPSDTGTNAGSDIYTYSLESTFNEVLCNVENLVSTVSISTIHNLKNDDLIEINIISNKTVGIGTNPVKLKYIDSIKSLIAKSLYFSSSDVNVSQDTLNIINHGFNEGDAVYYISTSIISGLSTDLYYVNKIDSNNIRLSETYTDSVSQPPVFVNFGSSGIGTQELHLVYPEIKVTKNDNLIFDLTDSSLEGYNLKLYYDKDFKNEFSFIKKNDNSYILSGLGTVGISTTAFYTLKYDDNLPNELYYTLEKQGANINPIDTIPNSSKISFINSSYSKKYNIFNITNTTFDINLDKTPEKDLYLFEDCTDISYTTTSSTTDGPVSKVIITDKGNNYSDIPYYKNSSSKFGYGLYVIPESNTIGTLNSIKLKNNLFEYSSDSTLLPAVYTPFRSDIENSNVLTKVNVIYGGKNYPSPPELVVIDSDSKKEIFGGLLVAQMSGKTGTSNVNSVLISIPFNGLPSNPVEIKAVNNSNGIIIDRITSSSGGIMTCLIKTPILGFIQDPFQINEDVFVDNIENVPGTGIGFNSRNHGYQFFKVIDYEQGSNPGKLVLKIPELYGNPGVAVTFQNDTFPSIVKKSNYPIFSSEQEYAIFSIGENLSVVNDDGSIVKTDLIITKSKKNHIKYIGKYKLSVGDVILGSSKGYKATIQSLNYLNSSFVTSGINEKSFGWEKETGQTSNDLQLIPDNDYYQNLSYTIKSVKTWNEISPVVNSTVHAIGTKNFADTQISSIGIVTAGISTESYVDIITSYISQSRVDVIKNFDLTKDFNIFNNKSNLIKFKNLKLIDYFESNTNRVLQIDDISGEFSSSDDDQKSLRKIISVLSPRQLCTKFRIQIKSSSINDVNQLQFTEFIAIKKKDQVYYLEKNSLSNKDTKFVDIVPSIDESRNYYIEFIPENPYDIDYEIKILKSEFSTSLPAESSKVIGSSNILNKVLNITKNTTSTILSLSSSNYSAFYSEIHIFNQNTFDTEYVELYAINDVQNVYYSDYYFNSQDAPDSYGTIGSFGLTVSNGTVSLNCLNKILDSDITVSIKTIAFNNTSNSEKYRFKSSLQLDESERSVIYDSNTIVVSSASTIVSYDRDLFSTIKSIVNVSIGNTFSLHQLALIQDSQNCNFVEYPMILSDDNIGIGTFGAKLNSDTIDINFYPEARFVGSNISIKYYNEVFYTFLDEINSTLPLDIKPLYEDLGVSKYIGLNSKSINRLNFKLYYKDDPIFAKTFNPNDSNILNSQTGTFTIPNHFFSTGEKLFYKPKSTYIGVGQSSMGIVSSVDENGISTNKLPSTVYAIKIDNDHFKVASNKQNSLSGIGVVFTNLGEGNAHMFEMEKKNEKTIITLNNLIQYPIRYSNVTHYLSGNNGQIGVANTFFTLSGISSVKPTDLLKIDNEYMKVLNVGIGTSNTGPILFYSGDKNIVEVERGFVGSSATTHSDGTPVYLYRGSYNISEDQIYFTQPPRGNVFDLVTNDERNLPRARAKFTGRVFLRQDYSTNLIFDDVSEEFTGIAQTFSLKRQGISTVGLGTTAGNGFVLINGIYQTPLTENITNYNFRIVENTTLGISSVVFSGIRDELDNITISEADVNKNQIPRGGIIVSLGSTSGLGYAPLVGANVRAVLNNNGSISGIVGIATTGSKIGFTTISYNNITGIMNVYTPSTYPLRGVNQVKLVGLGFTYSSNPGIVSYFPNDDYSFNVVGVGTTSFSIQVGTSTVSGYYVGYGTIYPWYETLSFGSGYRGQINVEVSDDAANYVHKFVSSQQDSVQEYPSGDSFTPSYAVYSPSTGILTLTIKDHGLTTSDQITIDTESIVFSCSSDNYTNQIAYPRATDPIAGIPTSIISYTENTISVGVGSMVGSGTQITATVNDGGILSFNIINGGTNYVDPIIKIPTPNYENLSIKGVSRLGIGNTTDTGIGLLMNVEVGPKDNPNNTFFNINYSKTGNVGITSTIITGINTSNLGIGNTIKIIPSVIGTGTRIKSIGIGTVYLNKSSLNSVAFTNINFDFGYYFEDNNSLVGIGTTLFQVRSFKITRPGYNFRRGDVFTPVGLVTAKGFNSPIEEFRLFVLEIYNDSFASWQFGEINLLDSIKRFQNGKRQNYPLYYNGELLSFQKNQENPDSLLIDFDSLLVIFINGILQEPKISYEFNGGSVVRFTSPPKENDLVEIYYYAGTRNQDSRRIEVNETIKIGDTVQIYSNNGNLNNTVTQNTRTVFNFPSADLMETNIYSEQGIDDQNYKPLFWIKQKEDLIINDIVYSKSRDSIEPQVYPTSKIIKDFTSTDTQLFVDDISIFNYEEEFPIEKADILIVPSYESILSGIVTAIVSSAGTIQSLSIVNPGFGYTEAPTIKISNPYYGIGVGVGTTAVLSINVNNGSLQNASVVNSGFGYTNTNPPQVLVSNPKFMTEKITGANVFEGFSGSIIGIGTTAGIGTSLAITFEIKTSNNQYTGLQTGYPIYVFDTKVGSGVTSIDSSENIKIGISTQYLDNIYYVHRIQNLNNVSRVISCNVSNETNIVGIATTGLQIGKFSWGKISGFSRSSNPVSIAISSYNVSSGLSTYPTIQRRGYGLRNTGALKKDLIT